MTQPKKRIKGKHLQIDRGRGAKEIHQLRKTPAPAPPAGPRIAIELDEKTARGAYANAAAVAHGENEFVMDFLFMQSASPRAKVHTRVVSHPRHTKRFLAALQENIRGYEKKFGPIR
ncbi:MAG: DUF3467 domain-containing protein [Elusimicrobiota bacterium]